MDFLEEWLVRVMGGRSLRNDKNIICVEGETDKKILEKVFFILYPGNKNFEIVTPQGRNGGANWVIDFATARAAISSINKKTAILIDKDRAGDDAEEKLKIRLNALDRPGSTKTFKLDKYKKTKPEIKSIFEKGFLMPVSLEDLYDTATWDHADKNGWLNHREEINLLNHKKTTFNKSLAQVINSSNLSKEERILFTKKVNDLKKVNLNNHICSKIILEGDIPIPFKKMAEEIYEYFNR